MSGSEPSAPWPPASGRETWSPTWSACVSRRIPERLVVTDGAQSLTRREVYDRALRLGSALARRGLRKGAVVAFQLPNWSEACVISLSCALYGFVLCPLLLMYRERELGFILAQTECEAIFVPGHFRSVDHLDLLARALAGTGRSVEAFTIRAGDDRAASFEGLLAEAGRTIDPPDVDPGSVKSIGFTSGSTGRPKGVLHSHDTMHATIRRSAAFWGIDGTDRLFVPSPIGHVGGAIYAFEFPWFTGASAHLMEVWDAAAAVDRIDGEKLTFCAGATPFLQALLERATTIGTHLPSLRRFVCGGASVPVALVESASRQFRHAVVSRAYGSSEVPLVCPGIRTRSEAFHGQTTDGEIDIDIRIVDAEDRPVPPGQDGDILARSSGMLLGYLETDDEDGQLTADGYFRMGDVGRLVEGRYLEITGRRKEIIIRLGENISPLEIENVLLQCAAVERVAVVGIPNDRTGERAAAFVSVRPGHHFGFDDMQDFLRQSGLARQKFPEELHVMDALPTNSIGKILKSELKLIATRGHAAGAGAPEGSGR